jgi:hypothetical protein
MAGKSEESHLRASVKSPLPKNFCISSNTPLQSIADAIVGVCGGVLLKRDQTSLVET